MLFNCFAVGAGGFLGAVFRYLISLMPFLQREVLPLPTLLVNVAGAIVIGIVVKTSESSGVLNEQALLFLKVGVCGGFTTFSSFALESLTLMQDGKSMMSLVYMAASVVLCILGVYLGKWIAGYFGA